VLVGEGGFYDLLTSLGVPCERCVGAADNPPTTTTRLQAM
jgi:hypothetical protein